MKSSYLLTSLVVLFGNIAGLDASAAKPLTVNFIGSRGTQSKSFAGSNLYFLHALPLADQTSYVKALAGWGVKVLRLWGNVAPIRS